MLTGGFAGDCMCGLCAGTREPARRLVTVVPRIGDERAGAPRIGEARGGGAGLDLGW